MKPVTFLILICFLYSKTHGQKIFLDKTDPFTNIRNINTDNGKLVVISGITILQAGCARSILIGKTEAYTISLLNLSAGIMSISKDSIQFSCQLKGANGKIYIGTWQNSSQVPIGSKVYQGSSYSISQNDAIEISLTEIVAVKFSGVYYSGTFEISEKYRKQIPKQLALLASVN
jgi:hypothetical protein